MKYAAINIQGNIITSEVLEKIRTEDFRYQKPIDFGFEPTDSIRDEISLAWSVLTSHWQAFQHKRENLRDHETGTTETRRAWMIPLLQLLGFDVSVANAEIINGKSYAISHRATNLKGFPIHIVGINQTLDKRAESGGARLSPHALGQEYLNNHEHLYALVSNGKYLRLLRDATLLSRLSFVEFDLEKIMEENLYAEFALMFRLLHASRMPQKIEEGPDSKLEYYHVEALASGSRIRERLSKAVEISIQDLANGLLVHPDNKELRDAVLNEKISAKDFYLYNLRVIYRILFLLVIEDRKLIYPEKTDEELTRKQEFYYNFYSLQRLTNLAENLIYVDPKKTDLWSSLLTTFSLFEYKEYGEKLGIAPLGSGIFHPNALGIIRKQVLDNENLLKVLRYLVSFENENKQRVRVNYADLDVEEFGSVYEGLLEYEPKFEKNLGIPVFTFVKGTERSSSGSHYTPEELVKPLLDHSLKYQIEEKLKEDDPEKGLLSLTVCDVACGSGHILLSAARRIGFELAKVRSGEDQPTPSLLRVAIRDVINHCIYGVDLNPLAVELCKVALWLEAHQPGEPLNFLDHHIKCGNAIVGLAHFEELKNGIATEAFKTLPEDDGEVTATFKKANEQQRQTKGQLSLHDLNAVEADIQNIQQDFSLFLKMEEHTPQQIEIKTKAYESLTSGKKWFRVKQLADLQIAQFFIPKTAINKEKITTEAKYQNYLSTGAQIQDRGASMSVASEKKVFHWFLEFPQIIANGGFDCILGNPPYLGGNRISRTFGKSFSEFIKFFFQVNGNSDLVIYFINRIYQLLKTSGFSGLITSQSVKERTSREDGLLRWINNGGQILFAITDKTWPGEANTIVDLTSLNKSQTSLPSVLNGRKVSFINTYLTEDEDIGDPLTLHGEYNAGFVGCYILGDGFIINDAVKQKLMLEEKNKDIVCEYLIGDDLNADVNQAASRNVLNFYDWKLEKVQKYTAAYNIILEAVKPVRDKITYSPNAKKNYWQYERRRPDLYLSIAELKFFLITAKTSKYLNFIVETNKKIVFDQSLTILPIDRFDIFAIVQSSLHNIWSRKYSTTQGGTPRYNASDTIQKYPFPDFYSDEVKTILEESVKKYNEVRNVLLHDLKLGLTKTYNQFHNHRLVKEVEPLQQKDFEKQYGKETLSLYSHLEINRKGNISYEDAVKLIFELQKLLSEMDKAVLKAYNWEDIVLRHGFYEIEYLPEKDRVRYTIHPEARKEILKRLLKLNHQRFEEEAAQGLHKKKDIEAYFKQKGEEIPDEIAAKFSKKKSKRTKKKSSSKTKKVEEPSSAYKLDFGDSALVSDNSKVLIKKENTRKYQYHIKPNAKKGEFTGDFKQVDPSSALAKAMLGKQLGDKFKFGEVEYEIIEIN